MENQSYAVTVRVFKVLLINISSILLLISQLRSGVLNGLGVMVFNATFNNTLCISVIFECFE